MISFGQICKSRDTIFSYVGVKGVITLVLGAAAAVGVSIFFIRLPSPRQKG